MTIRNLEIFDEVCRKMSMSKAAESLMISQSSVSQAISALEKEFETTLFERLNHKLYLTDAGRKMQFLTRQVLQSTDQLQTQMMGISTQDILHLGVCTTIGNCLAYPLIQSFRRGHDTDFRVEVGGSRSLEKKLLNARLDLAVLQVSRASQYLEYVPFLTDEMTIICPPDHPLAGRTIPFRDLEQEGFVTREKDSGTEILLEQTFSMQNMHLKKTWACISPESVMQAVAGGCGIALISGYVARKELAEGTLSEIHTQEPLFGREFVLAYHRDKRKDGSFLQFIEYCRGLGNEGLRELIGGE